jgi:pimeloyl-ACP methyl ester carboxylesterase
MRRTAVQEDMFDKQPLPPETREERDGHAAPLLPETPASIPDASPPISRSARRGKVPRWLLVTLVGILALAALASATGLLASLLHRQPNPPPATPTFQTASCPFKPAAGVVEGKDVRCGYLTVPEDHSRPQGPTIRLAVAIFKFAYASSASDPVVYLDGGPGYPSLASRGPTLTKDIHTSILLGDRDLILLDQRGVGNSQPSLDCPEFTTMADATFLQQVRACHDRLVRFGINLNAYNTIQNADDVHDLVRALGYRQVNLFGASYGTRLSLTVMRLFPADIRSVVLDSTSPPQLNVFTSFPAAAQRAFDTLFQGCAATPSCNRNYPHLQAVFARQVTDLNQHPATVQVIDPQTGKRMSEVITGDDLVSEVRIALYQTALIPRLPKLISQFAHHDYSQLFAMNAALASASSESEGGMQFSVNCSENSLTPQSLEAAVQVVAPESRHLFLAALQQYYAMCQLWNVQPVPAVQQQAVTSAIPTLILSGEYDPVTPPAYGMLAARTLSRSYFFLFPGTGHGVFGTNSCVNSMFQAFLELPTRQPDATCMQAVGEPLFE